MTHEKREVLLLQTGPESPLGAMQYNLNMELAAPGREFDGIEFHVVGETLVAVVMFATPDEEEE